MDELALKIFEMTTRQDQASIAQVSRKFNSLANDKTLNLFKFKAGRKCLGYCTKGSLRIYVLQTEDQAQIKDYGKSNFSIFQDDKQIVSIELPHGHGLIIGGMLQQKNITGLIKTLELLNLNDCVSLLKEEKTNQSKRCIIS